MNAKLNIVYVLSRGIPVFPLCTFYKLEACFAVSSSLGNILLLTWLFDE
jgi:hypothetical protein